jgi:tetratricopeptide (TPR) repeat protein
MPHLRHRAVRLLASVLALASLAGLPGCESTQSGSSLESSLTAYRAGRYEVAVREAESTMDAASGIARYEAAYLAGLAAYRDGDHVTAERHLRTALSNPDRRTAAAAFATLGLIKLDQGRNGEAGDLFAAAYPTLDEAEARRAAEHAVLAYRLDGNDCAAARWATVTGGSTPRPAVATSGGFSIQIGAFRDRVNAHAAADAAETDARRIANTPARIVAQSDTDGQTRYLVQFGEFASRTAADAARRSLGRLDYIVAPTVR